MRLLAALDVGREVAVREHRALLPAGGAGGVDERGDVVVLRVMPVVGALRGVGGLGRLLHTCS